VATSSSAAPPPPPAQPPASAGRSPVVRYLTSTKNIAGSVGALGGLALFFTGVVGPLWPLVVAGLYGVGALLAPRERTVDLRSGVDIRDISKSLDRLLRTVHGRVPDEIERQVRRVAGTIQGILPRTGQLPPGSQELFILQRTVADYLPTSLEAYMNLPRAYAALHPLRGTKTAQQILAEQLDLLQQQMDEVADAVAKNDADRLLAQGRFLEERFGPSDLSIEGPTGSPPIV
jgi:hypothetical protein